MLALRRPRRCGGGGGVATPGPHSNIDVDVCESTQAFRSGDLYGLAENPGSLCDGPTCGCWRCSFNLGMHINREQVENACSAVLSMSSGPTASCVSEVADQDCCHVPADCSTFLTAEFRQWYASGLQPYSTAALEGTAGVPSATRVLLASAHGTCAVGKVCSLVTKACGSRPWCCHPGKAPREAVGRVFGTELKGLRGTRDFANNPAATENPERVRKQGIGESADVVSMQHACTLHKTAIVSTGERFCRPLQALCTVARLPSRATGCSTATAPFG